MPFHIVAVMTFTYLLAIFLLLAIALGYLSRFRRSRTEPRINDSEDSEEAIDVKSRKVGKPKPGFKTGQKYHMTMGLRKSDPKEWLQIDSEYLAVHKIKSVLLDENKSQVLQCLRGSEAACREVLDLVVEFLTRSFPKEFISWVPAPGIQYVMITKTQEIFKVSPPYDELGSLEIAARLAMEDFNIMIKGENDVHTL